MANEKDPRNLMLAFSVMKVILIEFDIVGVQEVPPKPYDQSVDGRNYLMPCFVIFRLPSRHDPTMSTVLRPTTSNYDYESVSRQRTTLPLTQSPSFSIK